MKSWSTDGRIERDTRYPPWLKWSFRHQWMPAWALSFLFRVNRSR